MIQEKVTVVSYQEGVATVACQQKSSCSGCASASHCGMSVLDNISKGNIHTLKLHSDVALTAGQQVDIGISEASLVRSAFTLYFIPLLGLVVSALIANQYFRQEWIVIVMTAFGTGIGFFIARNIAQRASQQKAYQPTILSTIDSLNVTHGQKIHSDQHL
ncbi:MAG: SoxR reducing system RseC family protein [Plesiomonas sp.]|uniref:SoxR reducing system RseC family protein n=1 Tax=Plesiomonas sp. TaxID=2486279 RepID=UPI003F40076A